MIPRKPLGAYATWSAFSLVVIGIAAAPPESLAADSSDSNACHFVCYRSGRWQVCETDNFRLHHVDQRQLAAELALRCETIRAAARSSWVGAAGDESWSPKCDVFLHLAPAEYAAASGQPAETRGYSSLEIGRGRVWKRRVDLRIDELVWLDRVLPHELTHVALADRFPTQQIPRWADEGIAILAEPPQRRQEVQRTLAAAQAARSMLSVRELLTARQYPAGTRGAMFYAQSASLVEYLVARHSRDELIRLLQTAQHKGYDAALREVLEIGGVAALEGEWKAWLSSAVQPPQAGAPLAGSLQRDLAPRAKTEPLVGCVCCAMN